MDRPSLPPELQEIETTLRALFQKGGLETCTALVNNLAAEAEFAQAVTDAAELTILKIEEDADTFPEIRQSADSRLRHLDQLKLEAEKVKARHAYAVIWLEKITKTAQ